MNVLTERISYLPATSNPLSSDVIIIHGDKYEWIYDVGCSDAAFEYIESIKKDKIIVISHFHADHTGNLHRVTFQKMYCGSYTKNRFGFGTEVITPITFDDGIELTLFPIPSSHSNGSLGIVIDNKYALLGDSVYAMTKNGKAAYNVNFLKDMISTLESIDATKFLLSHKAGLQVEKPQIIAELKEIYAKRDTRQQYLFLEK